MSNRHGMMREVSGDFSKAEYQEQTIVWCGDGDDVRAGWQRAGYVEHLAAAASQVRPTLRSKLKGLIFAAKLKSWRGWASEAPQWETAAVLLPSDLETIV